MMRNSRPYDSVIDTIGWTPLIRLHRITRGIRTPVYGKAEFFNPGGSVKDRIGLPMIEAAERAGLLKPGQSVMTGGDSMIFPKGITIGHIVDVRTNDYGLNLEARVKLAVNLNRLELVWVLLQ